MFLILQESCSKVGHAAREMATVDSDTLFISNSILLLLVFRQFVKTHIPRGVASGGMGVWGCSTS